ncbi:hypothetical protein HD806DRAFT_550272 [Xylariaceae sp. AK1471]|nr:hypothetical protein HD806DRAFT_550272 [Xylariaceae sp. AK1471]
MNRDQGAASKIRQSAVHRLRTTAQLASALGDVARAAQIAEIADELENVLEYMAVAELDEIHRLRVRSNMTMAGSLLEDTVNRILFGEPGRPKQKQESMQDGESGQEQKIDDGPEEENGAQKTIVGTKTMSHQDSNFLRCHASRMPHNASAKERKAKQRLAKRQGYLRHTGANRWVMATTGVAMRPVGHRPSYDIHLLKIQNDKDDSPPAFYQAATNHQKPHYLLLLKRNGLLMVSDHIPDHVPLAKQVGLYVIHAVSGLQYVMTAVFDLKKSKIRQYTHCPLHLHLHLNLTNNNIFFPPTTTTFALDHKAIIFRRFLFGNTAAAEKAV